jgi:protein-export membrane protein SecD
MSPSPRSYLWPTVSAIVGVYLFLVALPSSWKSWAPTFLNPGLHLGLDLQGGTQLDFRISEAEMEKQIERLNSEIEELKKVDGSEEDIADKRAQISNIQSLRGGIVEAIRTVLERRVNSLGVSEAIITPSFYGSEKHLLVECPGVIDIQRCIATVGKTILLEFKEQAEGQDDEHIRTMRELAAKAEMRITGSGESLQTVGEDLKSNLGVYYTEDAFYEDDLPTGAESLWDKKPGDPLLVSEVELPPVMQGDALIPHRGIFFAEVTGEKREVDRPIQVPEDAMTYLSESHPALTLVKHDNVAFSALDAGYAGALAELQARALIKGTKANGEKTILYVRTRNEPREEMAASHILISYKGAVRAEADVVRTKEEARTVIEEIQGQLENNANFERLARERSDGPSAQAGGGLGAFTRGTNAPAFDQAAFALKNVGDLSDIVETEFGYHIIRLDSAPKSVPGSLSFFELVMGGENPDATQTELLEKLEKREVTKKEEQIPLRSILFSFLPTGWKDTPLDGKHFRRASVTSDPTTGIPVVQIVFDAEGGRIFQELTKKNIGKPIAIFVGGELISAPTVQAEIAGGTAVITGSRNFDEANTLAQDLNTGAIPAPIHLVGQTTVEATLGKAALDQSLKTALLGFLLVAGYMIWYYRVLGVIATIALAIYSLVFAALLKLPLLFFTDQYIVLTLAGIAGVILSIGMAVDANVLIYERMKEELAKGKLLKTAAEIGFRRAWPSIRDSNSSTLLTASILFLVGSSIVRGFAVTLSMGVLLSMFTAIVVTRWIITFLYASPLANNPAAFGLNAPSSIPQEAASQGK